MYAAMEGKPITAARHARERKLNAGTNSGEIRALAMRVQRLR